MSDSNADVKIDAAHSGDVSQRGPTGTAAAAAGGRIRALPPLLVNQIAAGEVVDRPASVVKELIDNAIDAGASRVHLELERGGIELIRVTDDGGGIHPEDLTLALAAHATSKVRFAEDLDRIGTMGFRGEALASIASVSRMTIRSRSRTASVSESGGGAMEIDAEGDQLSTARPASGPVGTSVTVRNLFFNTPARRKFLRTPQTEQGHCVDIAQELALSHPHIGFSIACDGKRTMDLAAEQTPTQRVLAVLGEELEDQFVVASADEFDDARGVALWGLVGLPTLAKATAKSQHVFLNGRPIRDKTIQHAIREAYRGLIEPGKYPTAVLMLEMDPGAVDVNVHPAKTEVRFRDSSLVHGVVLRAVREALRQADLTPRTSAPGSAGVGGGVGGVGRSDGAWNRAGGLGETGLGAGVGGARGGAGGGYGANGGGGAGGGSGAGSRGLDPTGFADYFRRAIPGQVEGRLSYEALREVMEREPGAMPGTGSAGDVGGVRGGEAGNGSGTTDWSRAGTASGPAWGTIEPKMPGRFDPAGGGDAGVGGNGGRDAELPAALPTDRILQIHNSYVVTQDEQGILIIDQHALHERVMFEQLLSRVRGSNLESQQLLVPSVVRPSRRVMDRLEELAPMLKRLGMQLEPLGPDTVGVQAFPSFLFSRGVEPGEFTAELLERFDEEGFAPALPGDEAVLHEVLDMMACKAAIKAGDRMSEVELRGLLKLREEVERSSNCPHGRPTSIRLTIKELEKRFGRA